MSAISMSIREVASYHAHIDFDPTATRTQAEQLRTSIEQARSDRRRLLSSVLRARRPRPGGDG